MKKFMFFLCGFLFLLFSCDVQNKKDVNQRNIRDSIVMDSLSKAEMKIHPAPTGFMGIDWYTSKENAIQTIKKKDSVKIKRITDEGLSGEFMILTGYFAGHKINDVILTFYDNQFCSAFVSFGNQPDDFYEMMLSELQKKYGHGFDVKSGFVWDFHPFEEGAKVTLYKDKDYETNLDYDAPNIDKFRMKHDSIYHAKVKEGIKIKNKDL
jgi:hypothetical protein